MADTRDGAEVRLWSIPGDRDGSAFQTLRHEIRDGKPAIVSALTFAPDGRFLATAGGDGSICLWSMASPQASLSRRFQPHSQAISGLAFSHDGRMIASVSRNPGARVSLLEWQAPSQPKEVQTFQLGQDLENCLLAFALDDGVIYVAGSTSDGDCRVVACFLRDDRSPRDLAEWKSESRPKSIRISPDGKTIGVSSGPEVVLIDRVVGTRTMSYKGHGRDTDVAGFTFRPDGVTAVTAASDSIVRVWSVRGGDLAWQSRDPTAGANEDAALSPDGRLLLTTTRLTHAAESTVALWRLPD